MLLRIVHSNDLNFGLLFLAVIVKMVANSTKRLTHPQDRNSDETMALYDLWIYSRWPPAARYLPYLRRTGSHVRIAEHG